MYSPGVSAAVTAAPGAIDFEVFVNKGGVLDESAGVLPGSKDIFQTNFEPQ